MAPQDQPRQVPHLAAVHTSRPPLIDGRLDDPVWQAAPGSDAFTQQYPFDGSKPSERTLLRVLYDEDAIYIGFDCDQINTPIVEKLTRRDRDSESEWVWVHIDSRNEGKTAYMFAINVSGTIADGQIIDQTTFSWEWDENWEGRTAHRPGGWTAEIKIPIRVLRFDGSLPVQTWGFQAGRFIAERQETLLWAYFPRDVATPLAYLGRLEDMRGLKGGGALELVPFGVGYARRQDAVEGVMAGNGYKLAGSAGLNLKWHLANDVTLDAAFNPDFAQVEADQVILNLTNFETFLPEKRPFFLEGIDAFSFPLQVFYSRRIGAAPIAPTMGGEQLVDVPSPATIYGAGKVVGRLGPAWSLGALSAITAENRVSVIVDPMTRSTVSRVAAPTTAFNVLRLKRELGGAGHIGIIGTGSTTFDDAGAFRDAYLGGLDGRWRSQSADYVVSGAFVQSYIHGGPQVQQLDGTVIGAGATSPGGWFRVAKEGGKHLLWSAEYTGAGRTLDYNDVGYMARQNLHLLKASLGWRDLDPGKYTLERAAAFEVTETRNLSGLDLGQVYELNGRLRLRNFSSVMLAADFAPARFDDREVGDGTALERAHYLGGRFELATDPRGLLYATLANQTQIIGAGTYATSAQGSVTVHALRQLDIELLPQLTWSAGEYRFAHQSVLSNTDPLYFGKLTANSVSATLRASYTFTPQLTLQAYGQAFLAIGHFDDLRQIARPPMGSPPINVHLSDLAAAPQATPVAPATMIPPADFKDAAINVNVVFRWEYRLGSTIYFVYSHSQIPTVPVPTMGFPSPTTLDPNTFRHGGTSDVFLLKFSSWWAS
ncbi:MAG TPA: DUF5916 domain-containing protein [Polyangia bacterium]|nr:DUF5916 domain-containing protein [Polyangia bacterium]